MWNRCWMFWQCKHSLVGCLGFKDLVIEEVDARIDWLVLTSTGEVYTWGSA